MTPNQGHRSAFLTTWLALLPLLVVALVRDNNGDFLPNRTSPIAPGRWYTPEEHVHDIWSKLTHPMDDKPYFPFIMRQPNVKGIPGKHIQMLHIGWELHGELDRIDDSRWCDDNNDCYWMLFADRKGMNLRNIPDIAHVMGENLTLADLYISAWTGFKLNNYRNIYDFDLGQANGTVGDTRMEIIPSVDAGEHAKGWGGLPARTPGLFRIPICDRRLSDTITHGDYRTAPGYSLAIDGKDPWPCRKEWDLADYQPNGRYLCPDFGNGHKCECLNVLHPGDNPCKITLFNSHDAISPGIQNCYMSDKVYKPGRTRFPWKRWFHWGDRPQAPDDVPMIRWPCRTEKQAPTIVHPANWAQSTPTPAGAVNVQPGR